MNPVLVAVVATTLILTVVAVVGSFRRANRVVEGAKQIPGGREYLLDDAQDFDDEEESALAAEFRYWTNEEPLTRKPWTDRQPWSDPNDEVTATPTDEDGPLTRMKAVWDRIAELPPILTEIRVSDAHVADWIRANTTPAGEPPTPFRPLMPFLDIPIILDDNLPLFTMRWNFSDGTHTDNYVAAAQLAAMRLAEIAEVNEPEPVLTDYPEWRRRLDARRARTKAATDEELAAEFEYWAGDADRFGHQP